MEFDLIPQFIIIFSTGVIIFILGKNIGKLKGISEDDFWLENEKAKEEKEKFAYLFGRLMRRFDRNEYQKKIDSFWVWLEKTLRKIRINFLKIDNKIFSILEKLREKHIENKIETSDFEEKKDSGEEPVKQETIQEDIFKKEDKSDDNKEEKKLDENSLPQPEEKEAQEDEKEEQKESAWWGRMKKEAEYQKMENQEIEIGKENNFFEEKDQEIVETSDQHPQNEFNAVSAEKEIPEISDSYVDEREDYKEPEHEEKTEESRREENKEETDFNVKEISSESVKDEEENLTNKKEKEDKEKTYINMILKNPVDIKAYWNLGIIYSRKKNYKDAISCFRHITKIDPTYTKARKKAASLLEKMKEKRKLKNEIKKQKAEEKKKEKEEKNKKRKEKKEKKNARENVEKTAEIMPKNDQ